MAEFGSFLLIAESAWMTVAFTLMWWPQEESVCPSRRAFLIFLMLATVLAGILQELWVLADLCIHLIQIYIMWLGLWVFKKWPCFIAVQCSLRAYFKMGWPREHVVMNLLMKCCWNLGRLDYRGAVHLRSRKSFSSNKSPWYLLLVIWIIVFLSFISLRVCTWGSETKL